MSKPRIGEPMTNVEYQQRNIKIRNEFVDTPETLKIKSEIQSKLKEKDKHLRKLNTIECDLIDLKSKLDKAMGILSIKFKC